MKIRKISQKLDRTLLVLLVLVGIAIATAFWIGGWQLAVAGLTQTGQLIRTIWLRLLIGFSLAGLIQVLLPGALIAKWLGPASGLKGIIIGSYTGIIMTGGPYIVLPIVASVYRAGAGVGPIIALLTGHSLLDLQLLIVWQIPFFGLELPIARYIACLLLPPLAGLAGSAVFKLVTKSPEVATSDHDTGNTKQAVEKRETS